MRFEVPPPRIVTRFDCYLTSGHFADIACAIRQERGMLPVTVDSLYASYVDGYAAALLDGDSIVGYIRLSELVTAHLRQQLCLPVSLPDIYEIGSAIILDGSAPCTRSSVMDLGAVQSRCYRGQGFYTQLRHRLLEMFLDRIQRHSVLILGTTTNAKVVRVLGHAQTLGIHFYLCHHEEFPGVYPFTCTCDGVPGFGCQYGVSSCYRRISPDILPFSQTGSSSLSFAEKQARVIALHDSTQNCVMYVSDVELARNVNDTVLSQFGSRERLIAALDSLGYYRRSFEEV